MSRSPALESDAACDIENQGSSTERNALRPAQRQTVIQDGIGSGVMEVSTSPRQSVVVSARRLIEKLSRPKTVVSISSAGYCAIHWLVVHNFSSHVFLGALVFGAMAAVVVAWLSDIVRET